MANQQQDADFENPEDGLPVLGGHSILNLLKSDSTALANALRRLLQSEELSHHGDRPESFAAFGSTP